jgi:hypothetical protein
MPPYACPSNLRCGIQSGTPPAMLVLLTVALVLFRNGKQEQIASTHVSILKLPFIWKSLFTCITSRCFPPQPFLLFQLAGSQWSVIRSSLDITQPRSCCFPIIPSSLVLDIAQPRSCCFPVIPLGSWRPVHCFLVPLQPIKRRQDAADDFCLPGHARRHGSERLAYVCCQSLLRQRSSCRGPHGPYRRPWPSLRSCTHCSRREQIRPHLDRHGNVGLELYFFSYQE